MSDRSSGSVSTLVHLAAGMGIATGLLLWPLPVGADWTRFHGDAANSGFADVVTAPAGKGSLSVPGLGIFAPGAGAVIASDGAVYLGTEQGKLIQLHREGNAGWTSELPQILGGNQSIVASPAVGADGSIYVIGVVTVRDHTGGKTVTRHTSEVHKFSPSGQRIWSARLPGGDQRDANASGPPNIWQSSGTEVVMVTASSVLVPRVNRLFALSTDGVILTETVVSRPGGATHAGPDLCLIFALICGFPYTFQLPPALAPADPADRLPATFRMPAPGPAVVNLAGGPLVIVADQFRDLVGFSFSPGSGFNEVFRVRDPEHSMLSSPMLLSSLHTAVGTAATGSGDGAIVFAGPEASPPKPVTVKGMGPIVPTPTRLADARSVVVEGRFGNSPGTAISLLRRVPVVKPPPMRILSRTVLTGRSIVPAAASRTHVFVSTAGAFHTFDAGTMTEVSRFSWVGGGMSPPAIGPTGHVYAIASNILFIFPPPPS